MTMATKLEVIKDKLEEYCQASKWGKSRILDQLEAVTRLHRKALIRRLAALRWGLEPSCERRGRKEVYNMRVTAALKEIWGIANEICAERLHPVLAEYVDVLKRDGMWSHDEQTTVPLLTMSLGTMKNRLAKFPRIIAGKGRGSTKPSALKEIIPIRRGPWDNPDPGFGEVDTVAHCGSSLAGDYCYSVQYTDVATLWTCLAGQWNKGQEATRQSIERIKSRLPFPLLSIDPDTGSEFINWLLKDWCDERGIAMTRIRPYHKNDHGRIEQKNHLNVRQFLGYTRIEERGRVALMNELYDCLEDYINFFLPSMKCLKTERTGSKYRRRYDTAQTAYRRVLAHCRIVEEVKEKLQAKYATLNPKLLQERINCLTKKILINTHY